MSVAEPFGTRLRRSLDGRGPLCVGIDPHAALLRAWGLPDDVAGLERFCGTVVDALADRVAVLKPQAAFFERHGSRGIAVLERTVAAARSAGALVLLDAKRGDIGSTVQGYADAYLDPAGPLPCDAVTASPYLGVGALQPLVDTAHAYGAGVFVLALTSNPEGREVQQAVRTDGRTVAQGVLDAVGELNAVDGRGAAAGMGASAGTDGAVAGTDRGSRRLGSVGVVVGATTGAAGLDLSRVGGPLLAPGVGAQGATAADLRTVFGAALGDVLPSVSREVLRAGPGPAGLREAAERTTEACRAVLTGSGGAVDVAAAGGTGTGT